MVATTIEVENMIAAWNMTKTAAPYCRRLARSSASSMVPIM